MRPIAPPAMPGWKAVSVPAGTGYEAIEVSVTYEDGGLIMTMWEFAAMERVAILAGANLMIRFRGMHLPVTAVGVEGIDDE